MMTSTNPKASKPGISAFGETSRLRDRALLGAGLAAVIVLTLFIQLHMGICTDQIWLLSLCDRLLNGQTAYVDFIENSPPFAILIYMPPVIAARLLSLPQGLLFVVYIISLASASLTFCGYVLAHARRLSFFGEIGAVAAFVSVLLLPSANFGQRDHIVLLLAFPLMAVLAVRADSLQPPRWAGLTAGALSGIALAVRPDFALSFALMTAFVATRVGVRALFGCCELYAVAVSLLVSIVVSIVVFPQYFVTMAPIIRDVYFQNNSDWAPLLLSPGLIGVGILLLSPFPWQSFGQRPAVVVILSTAAIGVAASFLLQGKNFASHIYPALATSLLAFAITRPSRLAKLDAIATAVLGVWLVVDSLNHKNAIAVGAILTTILLMAVQYIYRRLGRKFPIKFITRRSDLLTLTYKYLGLGLGVWFLQYEWRVPVAFLDEVRVIGGHPKIAAIAHIGQIGLPLTNRVEGRWVPGVLGLIVADDVDRILATQQLGAASSEKLEKYRAFERQVFFSSLNEDPPDVLIVEDKWAQKHFDYPETKAWLDRYELQAKRSWDFSGSAVDLSLYVKAKGGLRSSQK